MDMAATSNQVPTDHQPHRWRRTTAVHPGTPPDLRHLEAGPRIDVGWTVTLTTQASYRLEPKTATAKGVIQLDGLVTAIRPSGLSVAVFWVQPSGWSAKQRLQHRSTPVVRVSYDLEWSDIDGPAGHPPTMWLAASTETLQDSAKQTARQHRNQAGDPPTWWSDLGGID